MPKIRESGVSPSVFSRARVYSRLMGVTSSQSVNLENSYGSQCSLLFGVRPHLLLETGASRVPFVTQTQRHSRAVAEPG